MTDWYIPDNNFNEDLDDIEAAKVALQEDCMSYSDVILDLLYEFVDQLMRDSKFSELDCLLQLINVDLYSTDILLGILTATLPARTKLPTRKKLFQQIREKINEDELLKGLE